jgi:serine/threonine protein kinase
LLDNGREVTELSDVWSLAVVAAEILSGEIPFDTQQYRQLTVESFVDALANDIRPSLPKLPDEIRKAVRLRLPPFPILLLSPLVTVGLCTGRSTRLGIMK